MKKEGLTSKEAGEKLSQFGLNEIVDTSKAGPFKILLRQVQSNFILYLLITAMIISFFVGKSLTSYTILAVILLVIITGFFQEYKAEKAISELKKMIMPVSVVIRDGKEREIPSSNIVPGDLLVLRTGEKIPADCIVVEEKELLLNESVITGESREVKKISVKGDKWKDENMLFMGSFIINGRCVAKVIHTGMDTKFGKIAGMISSAEKELPLQKKVNRIAKYMATIAIISAVLTGIIILLRSSFSYESLIEVLILTIALAVSAFPEGFPVVLTTTLSLGAYRMAKKGAIVNRMSIIETLGETTVICSDKTGTITTGEMTVKEIFADGRNYKVTGAGYNASGDFLNNNLKINVKKENSLSLILKTSVLCNDSFIERTGEDNDYLIRGVPTEAALLIMAAKANLFKDDMATSRIEEVPFSSERKMMSVLCKEGNSKTVYSKGAFEILLKKCKFIQRNNGVFRLLEKDRGVIMKEAGRMTSQALRVIGFAYKKSDSLKDFENDLVFLGLAGIEDPPREEIKDALISCKRAGINVKMITGDNRETAVSIARQINLEPGRILEGDDLDRMSDNDLVSVIPNISIFARVKPEHKLRIVKALKSLGEIVTMTGDGVNDSPALKEAHIGVAMGKNGTDVTRSVADLIIKDDNFATIVDSIREGRTIFKNIKKFVGYQLSCSFAELAILFFGVLLAPFLGWAIPLLLALQILFMNLVTDDIPAVTLGVNNSSKDVMDEKPRRNARILNKNIILLIMFSGFLMCLFTLASFYMAFNFFREGTSYSRTVAFVSLILLEIAAAFNFRSFRKGVFNRSLFVNKYLVYASLISIVATLLVVYTPLNIAFGTVPLDALEWLIALIFPLLSIVIFDILKKINNVTDFWKED